MKRPRRIAQFVESLAAGGAEKLAVDIANELAARGHDTHLLVLDKEGPFRERVHPDVAFHDLQRPRPTGPAPLRALDFLGTSGRLKSCLEAAGVEILQTHLPKANFLGLSAAMRKVCRVHPTVHNTREFDYGDDSGPWRTKLRKGAYRRMLTSCGTMIAVSEAVKEGMIHELGLPAGMAAGITVVDNGVPVPPETSATARRAARQARGLAEDDLVIACVGRLTPQKGFASLIDALACVSERLPGWCCVVAGEGELRTELEAGIRGAGLDDRLLLPGIDSDVGGLYRAADLFCLPSVYEGLPLALMEAMAAGLPVCAYAIDGTTEVVTHGVEGLLAPAQDAAALGDLLVAMARDPQRRADMGRAARARIMAHHDFRRVVDRLEEVYGDDS